MLSISSFRVGPATGITSRRARATLSRRKIAFAHRAYTSDSNSSQDARTVIQIPRANVYRFGQANTNQPVFKDLEWTVKENESWAVVGPAGSEKSDLMNVCMKLDSNYSSSFYSLFFFADAYGPFTTLPVTSKGALPFPFCTRSSARHARCNFNRFFHFTSILLRLFHGTISVSNGWIL